MSDTRKVTFSLATHEALLDKGVDQLILKIKALEKENASLRKQNEGQREIITDLQNLISGLTSSVMKLGPKLSAKSRK